MGEPGDFKENYNIDFNEIRELVKNYREKKESYGFKGYKEEATKNNFITPLFRALGWNTENRPNRNDSVSYEENISGKRSDYGFSINGITKFYLEAKSLKEEEILFGTDYDKQAVNYAWLKTCSWAVLTNFETLTVYNADSAEPVWAFTLKAEEYLSENGREKLKLLSKKGFEDNLLDKWAADNGKKPMKRLVDKQLLQDMIQFRDILSKDIKKNNPNISESDLDETVQRTLDRLVFIRNAEDREYEPKELSSNYRQWSLKESGHLIRKIRELYQHYRVIYNSGLFGKEEDEIHISDQVEISNEALVKVIQGLYSPEGAKYSYNFAVLDSDVLGRIYEQYLGNILKSTPKRAKIEESKVHRKEQGIYYTPSYIVDYIVKNTVGEYIKTHTPEEIKRVKIIDPACGSGSFLIRAYKELENYWKKNSDFAQTTLESEEFYSKKVEILKNNIFGVDLDPKAVEIAQLNLLLQISGRKQRLPILQNNIKVGNSLIDDPSLSDRAFKWEEHFPEIMKEGGFDIVIGNPPYYNIGPNDILKNTREFREVSNGVVNSASLFLRKGKSLLKNSGFLGFIIPKSFLIVDSWKVIRDIMLETKFIAIKDVSMAFEEVGLEQVIIINQKTNEINPKVLIDSVDGSSFFIPQSFFKERHLILTSLNPNLLNTLNRIEHGTVRLGEISEMPRGITVRSEEYSLVMTKETVQVLGGTNIERFLIKNGNKRKPNRYLPTSDKRLLSKASIFVPHRIIYQNIASSVPKIIATIDKTGYPTDDTLNNLLIKDERFSSAYVLGILNSNLMTFYLRYAIINNSILTVHLDKPYLGLIPIKITSKENQKEIEDIVEKIIQNLINAVKSDNTPNDANLKLKNDVTKLEERLNNVIYDLYGLDKKDVSVIESLISR